VDIHYLNGMRPTKIALMKEPESALNDEGDSTVGVKTKRKAGMKAALELEKAGLTSKKLEDSSQYVQRG
jgi:hypothetical protein